MTHYILAKFKEGVDYAKLTKPIDAIFQETLAIDGISKVEVKQSNSNRPNRYHIMIQIEMTKEALLEYDQSIPHQKWKEEYGPLLESKAIFDCD